MSYSPIKTFGTLLSCLIIISSIALGQGPDIKSVLPSEYMDMYNALTSMSPDKYSAAAIKSLTIRKEAAKFILGEGKLFLCQPIKGRVCAAVYTGKGVFSFIPPYDVEKNQLKRFYDSDTLNRSFEALYIIFGDRYRFPIEGGADFRHGSEPP